MPAHLRHGDKPGPCSAATIQETKKGRKHGDAQRNGKPTQDKRGQQPEDQAAESQPPADDSGQSQGEAGGERGRGRGHGKNRGGNEHKSGKK